MENEAVELLGRIEKVDPPPFLFTRIMARVQEEQMPVRWLVTTALVVCVLVALNVRVLRASRGQGSEASLVASAMGFDHSNQLYQ